MNRQATKRAMSVAAVGAVVTVGLVAGYTVLHTDDATASGPHAEFTRAELSRLTAPGSRRNPVLLPRDLPPTIGAVDGEGFLLLNKPITGGGRRHAGEVWMSVYSVDALPPRTGNVSGYRVYQEWEKAPERHKPRCDSVRISHEAVVRHVGDDKLTICLGPQPTEVSRDYWETVGFTSNLADVEWLRDGNP